MKTAISVPDDVFARVETAAAQLGVSRSAFFTTAARRWLRDLEGEATTEQIDAALAGVEGDENVPFLRDAARRLGDGGDGEW
ncbi:MAG: ribbon-helix-helix protein, CopG family [Patulibacter sp.]|nr:ribbon-helix-helix protein, CopG family [Patulibacter sp.]